MQLSGLAHSTFYYYLNKLDTDKYEREKQEIQEIYKANKGRYGYRRITIVVRNKGYVINHKTVQKLMKQLGLKGKQRKNDKYHSYKGTVHYYNNERISSKLKGMSPVQYRTHSQAIYYLFLSEL